MTSPAAKVNFFVGPERRRQAVDERIGLVSFIDYLGFFGDETCRLESADKPFQAQLSMSPA